MGGGKCGSDERGVARKITMNEVRQHTTQDDCWMVHQNKVLDVSSWVSHPGGGILFSHAGSEITDVFNAFHPTSAFTGLKEFVIGDLVEEKPQKQIDFESSYRRLRTQLRNAGLYKANHWYYLYKVSFNLSMLAIAVAVLAYGGQSYPLLAPVLSGAIVALFYQQCGWLAHDYLHNQVFSSDFSKGKLWGIFIGSVLQGFDPTWWMTKHNGHHALPNVTNLMADGSPAPPNVGDPDIDTTPFLAWTRSMAVHCKDSKLGRFAVRYQTIIYFPLLLVARLSWLMQSFQTAFNVSGGWNTEDATGMKQTSPLLAQAGLLVHYAWNIAIVTRYCTPMGALVWLVVSQCFCGFLLALVFGLGHNGMAVYNADELPDFWKLQVSTTRNVESTWFNDWFCGGLQYQIEHHLFPMIPRHNLGKVSKIVEAFCKENGLDYHVTGMLEGTREVLSHLSEVSQAFLEEFPGL